MTAEYGSGRFSPVFTSTNVTTATTGGAFSVPQTRTFWLYLMNEAGVSLPSPAVTVTAPAGGRISVSFSETNRDAATGYKYCFVVASLTATLDDAWIVGFWRLFQADSDAFATAAPIIFSRDEQLVVPPAAVSLPAGLPTGVSLVPGMVRLVSGGVSFSSYYIHYPWLITDPNSPYFRHTVDGDKVIERSPGEYWVRFGNPNFGLFPISGDISGDTGACRPLVAVDEEFLAQNLLFGANYAAADNTDSVAANAKGLTVFFGSDTGDDIAVGSRFGLNIQVDGFPATTLFDRRIVVRFLGFYNPATGILDDDSGLGDGADMAGIGVDLTQTNAETGFLALSKTLPGNQKAVFKIFPRFRASEIYPPLVQGSVVSIVPILLPQGGVRVPLASIFETSVGGFVAPIASFGRVVPGDGTLNVLPGLFVVRGHESALQPKQTIVQVAPNTLNQQLAITQDGRAVVRGVAGIQQLSAGEALLALFDFGTGESVAGAWSNNIVLSAAGGISITATYPVSGAFGMVRSSISEISGNTQAHFNPPQVRIYIKQGSTIYRLNSPQPVVIGTTQTFTVTDLTNTTVVAGTTAPPFSDFCLFDPPTVVGSATGGSLPIGTYQIAIAYSFLSGTQCTRIRQTVADGCIPAYRKSLFESNSSEIIRAIELLSTAGLIERTAGGSAAIVQLGALGRSILDDIDPSAGRTTLGLGNVAIRAIGTVAGTVRDAGDSAYTNARTPTTHASTHAVGGTDVVPVFGYLAVSTNSTLTTSNQRQLIDVNATSAAITITLPAAATVGSGWAIQIRKSDASANLVTISRAGSDTINGATTLSLAVQHQSLILFSLGGTSWGVVAGFPGTLPANSLLGTGGTAGIAGVIPSSTFSTPAQVNAAIAGLVNSSPAVLDTLGELATALGNDANFSTTVANSLADKVDKSSNQNIAGFKYFTDSVSIGINQSLSLTPYNNNNIQVVNSLGGINIFSGSLLPISNLSSTVAFYLTEVEVNSANTLTAPHVIGHQYRARNFGTGLINFLQGVRLTAGNSGSGNVTNLDAAYFIAAQSGAGTVTTLYGGQFVGAANAGTVTNLNGGLFTISAVAASIVETARGIHVVAGTSNTTPATNCIGIDIASITGTANNKLSIRTGLGRVTFGDTTPATSTTAAATTLFSLGVAQNVYIGGSIINLANIPTSSAGLAVGTLYRTGNQVLIA